MASGVPIKGGGVKTLVHEGVTGLINIIYVVQCKILGAKIVGGLFNDPSWRNNVVNDQLWITAVLNDLSKITAVLDDQSKINIAVNNHLWITALLDDQS